MKALVFGGAFNPPTKAHIDLARHAMEMTGYDHVIFVPSKTRYIQDDQGKDFAFGDAERLAMLEMIAARNDWMRVSAYELEAEEQPRTYETLCYLRGQGYDCSLLFGSDKLPELENGWQYVEEICSEFGIVCMKRNEDACEELLKNDPYLSTLADRITIVETPLSYRHVSSTQVRKLYRQIKECRQMLAELVPDELNGLEAFL